MTSPRTPRTPLERIEWQCSHLDEGKRYCDFCGEVIFPLDESHPHKDDCEVAQIKSELSALQRQPEPTATRFTVREGAAELDRQIAAAVMPDDELAVGCHRAHPHENMNAECMCKTELAELKQSVLDLSHPNCRMLLEAKEQAESRCEAMREALIAVLPMAKGYAAEHPVGNNQQMVNEAADAIANLDQQISAASQPSSELIREPITKWEDSRVQIVYEILCSDEAPINSEEHWEGFVARRIVDALGVALRSPTAEQVREACARVLERRAEARLTEYGVRKNDTNTTYYSGPYAKMHEICDTENKYCASVIRDIDLSKVGVTP